MERIRREVLTSPDDPDAFATSYTDYYTHTEVAYPRYLCNDCHRKKTLSHFRPISTDEERRRAQEIHLRVHAPEAIRICDAADWKDRGVRIACSPENLRLGQALDCFRKPDRVVLGCDPADRSRLTELFAPVGGERV